MSQKFTDVYGGEFTAADLLADARKNLNNLADSADGTQMHRRAVVGRKLTVHRHGISGDHNRGYNVAIRVETQYTDQAYRKIMPLEQADELIAEVEHLLTINPIGIER